ncbi:MULTISPECIES: hypothetical protein [Marinobacter]|uniref:hypothetical protein n=1 Tax=Marinobacter TaxID=2742 RepID=UPI000DAC07D4|nr:MULTISPECIES: hypothetical protein [Marinobacter]
MGFLSFLLLLAIVWLLWTISRNSTDALDKQTAMQHQLIALEKRIESLVEQLADDKKAKSTSPNRRSTATKTSTGKSGTAKKSGTGSKNSAKAEAADKPADNSSPQS